MTRVLIVIGYITFGREDNAVEDLYLLLIFPGANKSVDAADGTIRKNYLLRFLIVKNGQFTGS